jgi:hypothetical protein
MNNDPFGAKNPASFTTAVLKIPGAGSHGPREPL